MKVSVCQTVVAVIAFWIGCACGEGNSVPGCVYSCFFDVNSELEGSSCGTISVENLGCFCNDKNVREKVFDCAEDKCSKEEQVVLMGMAMDACSKVDAPLPSSMRSEISAKQSSLGYTPSPLPSDLSNIHESDIPPIPPTTTRSNPQSTETANSQTTNREDCDCNNASKLSSLFSITIFGTILAYLL
ncbi:hypothetical protein TRICI_003776 [Trichomonascus ciferrii]|uniref:CFEM domain-containing protein n=1 Tax=Trichomonascus ciferrii TaxID=44093 RepID=A0A642V320_9ASCO|nr:hypothetical protein TRICI_003776 [Trichomonascus ciferrii]